MNSLIFRTAARVLLPLLILFSVIVLLRGHNEPGGGFVGGLIVSSAFALYSMAFGVEEAVRLLRLPGGRRVSLPLIIGSGLSMAISAPLLGLVIGGTFFEGLWWKPDVPGLGVLGFSTVLLFDVGVYVTVFGVVTLMLFTLSRTDTDGEASPAGEDPDDITGRAAAARRVASAAGVGGGAP